MASAKASEVATQAKETWSVVVICEDDSTRCRAMSVCDTLVKQFWGDIEFQFHWCQLPNLADEVHAHHAAQVAAEADMIVWATSPEGDFPQHVNSWIQTWLERRGRREGAFVALIGPEGDVANKGIAKHLYLREVAHKACMDFLSEIPQCIPREIPESVQWFTERAGQVSSTLDGILKRPFYPPRLVD